MGRGRERRSAAGNLRAGKIGPHGWEGLLKKVWRIDFLLLSYCKNNPFLTKSSPTFLGEINLIKIGARAWIWTKDLIDVNDALCQLSHASTANLKTNKIIPSIKIKGKARNNLCNHGSWLLLTKVSSWRKSESALKLDAWNAWGLNRLNRLMFLRFKRLIHFKHFAHDFIRQRVDCHSILEVFKQFSNITI